LLPIFRKSSPYPAIHDQVIPGSPEHSQPEDLRSAAWRLINDSELARESVERDRAMSLVHNGKGALDPAEIAHAGQEGRIDTLYLPRTGTRRQASDTYVLANDAALATVRTTGSLRSLGRGRGHAQDTAPPRDCALARAPGAGRARMCTAGLAHTATLTPNCAWSPDRVCGAVACPHLRRGFLRIGEIGRQATRSG